MKRSLKLIGLCGVLAVLVGGTAAVTQLTKKEESKASEESGSFTVADYGEDGLSALSFTADGNAYAFSKSDGEWIKSDDLGFPVNQTALSNLEKKITGLTAQRRLTGITGLADYGLAEPSYTVTVKAGDGAETVYSLGAETPFEDGYYLSVSGQDGVVYTVKDSLADTFDKSLAQLAELEEIPEVSDPAALRIGGTLDLVKNDAGDWTVRETGEALDASLVGKLTDAVSSLAWNDLKAVSATEEEMQAFGLAPGTDVLMTGAGGTELHLILGGTDDSGNVYAKLADSAMVYTLAKDDVSAVQSADISGLWQKKPVTAGFADMTEMAYTLEDGRTLTVARRDAAAETASAESTAAPEETVSAESTAAPEAAAAVTLNGAEDTAGTGEALFAQLAGISGTERVQQAASGSPVLTVKLSGAGAEKTLSFYWLDADSYLLPVTDGVSMKVSADSVDKLIRMVKAAL